MATRTVASVGTKEYDELLRLLREVREEAGVAQEALSKRLGRARTYVTKIEAGTRRLDVIELVALCTALEKNPLDFIAELVARISAVPHVRSTTLGET